MVGAAAALGGVTRMTGTVCTGIFLMFYTAYLIIIIACGII
jgi:hypothetical protein